MADHNTTKHFLMDILDFVSPKNVPTYNRAGQIVKNPNDMIPVAIEGLGTMLRDAGRGTVTGVLGAPGDISEAIRSFKTKHRNRAGQYVNPDDILGERYFPTSEELQNKLGYEQSVPLKLGQHIVAPMIGPGEIVKGIKATKDMPVGLSMIGEGSKLWNKTMEKAAIKMEKGGAKAEEIRNATGLVRGLDGHWRDELSDQFAKMKENPLLQDKEWAKDKNFSNFGALHKSVSSGNQPVKVKDVLEHQDLYDAYPHLRNIEVVTHKAGSDTKGAYYPGKNKISISEDLKPEEAKSTLLHELTHDIQNFEGWNHGANSKAEIKKYYDRQNEIIEQIRGINAQMSEANKVGDTEKYHQLMAIRQPLNEEYLRIIEPEKLGIRDYMNNAGEAEARLVQARMNLPPEELIKHFPYEYTGSGKGKYGLDIHPDEAVIPSKYSGTINQPSQSLDIKGFKDEGNYRRVGEPQSNLEKFGITGNIQGSLPGGLIENAGRITRGSDPNDIKAQAEFIQANLNNPEFNKALALAQKHNPDFDLKAIADMPESSLQKQHAIARTYDLLTKESVPPQLKQAIYQDYLAKHPEMMKREGIKDYDDLVTKSYGQLRKEIDQQFDDMVKGGMKLSYHQGNANYLDSKEMLRDALVNNHLYTYRGGDVHPLLNDLDPYYGLNSNEKFRAVHDFFGHGTTGATFGRKGEELAYGAHAQTLSPLARIAAAAETRGQNSFVNYSGINAELESKMIAARIARDEAKHQGKPTEQFDELLRNLGGEWQYAKQQGLALPPEMLETGYAGAVPDYIKAHFYPEHGVSHKGYHYSNLSDLEETDPLKYGSGITGAEGKRLSLPGAIKERTYFYNEPGMREPGLGRYQYESDLEHFYDVKNDPLNIIKMADNFNRNKYGILNAESRANDIERMMHEAGYHGYVNPNTGVGISFHPQRVREFSSD
jgi:hypothetical protein